MGSATALALLTRPTTATKQNKVRVTNWPQFTDNKSNTQNARLNTNKEIKVYLH